jgi:chemotaxis protein CheZ
VQRKVFRIERTVAAERRTAPTVDAAAAHPIAGNAAPELELARIHDMIARNKRELAALLEDGKQERRMARAAGELGATVEGIEKATQGILKSAESIDDGAKALAAALKNDYERGLTQDIQEHVVRIFEACNFQDLAGQRIGKVIAMLGMIEIELAAMLTRCNGGEVLPDATATPAANRDLINGPKLDGDSGHASQRDIDQMFS